MTLDQFKASLASSEPPDVTPLLEALWHDAHGDWERAHRVAQDASTRNGAWVHAYLHRKEGDVWNARYWYDRAGQPEAQGDLHAEWDRLVVALL